MADDPFPMKLNKTADLWCFGMVMLEVRFFSHSDCILFVHVLNMILL